MSSLRVPRQAVGQARSAQLLAEHYASARVSVLRKARGDLRSANHFVTDLDLDAAYNGAWLDLVAQVDAGAEVDNPPGWLVIATKRRAIDGRRSDHASRELPLTAARQLSIAGDEMVDQIDRSDAVRAAAAVARHKFSERDGRVAALLLTGHSRGEISMKTGLPLKRLHKILDGHKGRRAPRAARCVRRCDRQRRLVRCERIVDPRVHIESPRAGLAEDRGGAGASEKLRGLPRVQR